ncbi:hypothetical protein F5Y16DRAFT_405514 [Xylariaceae sp. FL0255]|nr:hypothetical protein F5Y16DRAFT_405514 [Xylariaceae sp. FL0255]
MLLATQQALTSTIAARRPRPKPLLEGKLRIDGDALGSNEARFLYVYGRFDSKVQLIVRLLFANLTTFDHATLLAALDRVYHDPNRQIRAAKKLHTLTLENRSNIRTFLILWEKVSHGAPSTSSTGFKPSAPQGNTAMDLNAVDINTINASDVTYTAMRSIWTPEGQYALSTTPTKRLTRRLNRWYERCSSATHQVVECNLLPYGAYLQRHSDAAPNDFDDGYTSN